jgi:hypothetical protein
MTLFVIYTPIQPVSQQDLELAKQMAHMTPMMEISMGLRALECPQQLVLMRMEVKANFMVQHQTLLWLM